MGLESRCMAKAFLDDTRTRELICEDIARIQIDGGIVRLSTLFGDQQEIKGTIREIDFESGDVIVEATL